MADRPDELVPDEVLLGPATTPALAHTVADRLRETIVRGAFVPGQHLREAELAAAMDVSRGPVREALGQLEREGLVVLRRHRGAQVAELSRSDIEEVYTLRLALERLAASRAASRAGGPAGGRAGGRDMAGHLAALDEVIERMGRLGPDYAPEEATALDLAFHDVVFRAADHARLQRAWEQLRSQVYAFLVSRNVVRPDFYEIALAEHTQIRDLLAAGDESGIATAIETHLEGAYRRLIADHDEARTGGQEIT